jgi:hypothetical protein
MGGQTRQPGLLAQAASTMGGAVAGSVIGHGISNMIFGGRPVDRATAPSPEEYAQNIKEQGGSCDIPAKGQSGPPFSQRNIVH